MTFQEPTEQQAAIVESNAASFVVQAGAGSGKTSVLVARYLRHVLKDGIPPGAILTVTFTNLAANEMRRRIVAGLVELGRPDLAQAAETGPVSTLHALCERVLRENALSADIDPDFEIVDGIDLDELRTSAVREAILETDEPDVRELIARLAGRSERFRAAGPYGFLESRVLELVGHFRPSGFSKDDLLRFAASPADRRGRLLRLGLSESARAALAGAPRREGESDEAVSSENLAQRLRELQITAPAWLKQGATVDEAEHDRTTLAAAKLAADAWFLLEARMDRLQRFDFAGVERRAVKLLVDRPDVAARLRERYRTVLVDEAQDLNPTQHIFLDSLAPDRIMYVGDYRQSIFGFRQADPDRFADLAARLDRLPLARNHRSGPGILRFVDEFGRGRWGEAYLPMLDPSPFDLDASPTQPTFDGVEFWAGAAKREHEAAAEGIRALADAGERPGDIAALVQVWRFGEQLRDRLEAAGVPARLAGGARKFYAFLEIRDLANALLALTNPSDAFSLLAVLLSPMCGLSLDGAALLAASGDVYGALGDFESPVEGDSERLRRFRDWFEPLVPAAGMMPAWEVLSEIFARSGYLEALARRPRRDQTIANVRKLLAIAAEHQDMGPADFAERMRDVQEFQHRDVVAPSGENEPAVTILTVHQAKGLEFPVVVLAQTGQAPSNHRLPLEVDVRNAAFSLCLDGKAPPFHLLLAELRKERELDELARVLYVALTRAKRRLAVVLEPKPRPHTMARILAQGLGFPGGKPPPGLALRGDWATGADRDER